MYNMYSICKNKPFPTFSAPFLSGVNKKILMRPAAVRSSQIIFKIMGNFNEISYYIKKRLKICVPSRF